MSSFVFRGKNWKLASEKRWVGDNVDSNLLKGRVGKTVIGGKEYEVFALDEGFAAVSDFPKASSEPREPSKKAQWVINVAGGNVNRFITAKDENEARKILEQVCQSFNSSGALFLVKEDGSTEKLYFFNARVSLNEEVEGSNVRRPEKRR